MTTRTARVLTALARRRLDGAIEVCSPAVGWWHVPPEIGSRVIDGGRVGRLEVLGRRFDLVAPEGGVVLELGGEPGLARRQVAYGDLLAVLTAEPSRAAAAVSQIGSPASAHELVLRAPSSGRFYGRPAPGKAPFVQVGDEITSGQTVCLLEVMKTFNRVTYGGDGLPDTARVAAIGPADGDDLAAGDVILELERAGG